MTWRPWLTDLQTGFLRVPVDIPQFSWSVTVKDTALVTTPDHGVGNFFETAATGLTIPLGDLPATTSAERFSLIAPGRTGLALLWETEQDHRDSRPGTPLLWGGIDVPETTPKDVSFALQSIYQLMSERYLINERKFENGKSTNKIVWNNYSKRALAAKAGKFALSKPGGQLPIDWQYLNEKHIRQAGDDSTAYRLAISAWNVGNSSVQHWYDELSSGADGVDLQFRPYLTEDQQHVRSLFVAGSDNEHYLNQSSFNAFQWTPQGGTCEAVSVKFTKPINRVYATGSGTDAGTLTGFAEDLALLNKDIGYGIVEEAISNTDLNTASSVKSLAKGMLGGNSRPRMQISFDWFLNDNGVPSIGSFWPGEELSLYLEDYPFLPDGTYKLRAQQFSGDRSAKVHVVTDIVRTPYE